MTFVGFWHTASSMAYKALHVVDQEAAAGVHMKETAASWW
jgi:hypothetical protein